MAALASTRRTFLRSVAAGAGVAAVGGATPLPGALPLLGASPAAAAPAGRLVMVFLRGGIDGLSVCVPYTEAAYHAARGDIAIPDTAVVDLDGQFGMHPVMAPLHGLYQENRFGFVHAVGNPAGNRSHFEAQAYVEQGTDGTGSDGFGWLARHLNTSGGFPGATFRAVAISANTPRSLGGYTDAITLSNIEEFGLGGVGGLTSNFAPTLDAFYTGDTTGDDVGQGTLQAIEEISGLPGVDPSGYNPTAVAFGDAATLLGAGLGIEIITIDIGGWDTHNDMGPHTGGTMYDLLDDLTTELVAFQTRLDNDGLNDVTTVMISDFGRRVARNGSGGTDHGKANVIMAMGANINGGQVITDNWPTVSPGALDQGDLELTIDYRDVLCELADDVLGHPNPSTLFPDHTCTPIGLTT